VRFTIHRMLTCSFRCSLIVIYLYGVCVPLRWKLVPDPRYPCRTLEIRDRMRTGTLAFCSAKRQVANMMRSSSARLVERDFDPGLQQRVLWFNFLRLGFCFSSYSSSLGVSVEDFVDLLSRMIFVQIPAPWWILVSSY
jgi:hypothetical protein